MTTIEELLKQKERLEAQIEEARRSERSSAIEQVKQLIATHGLSAEEVFGRGRKRGPAPAAKVAPKYRDPASGRTWSGRGRVPTWMRDKPREAFKIG